MLDRFTEPAPNAIVRAIDEARNRGHAEVGPAHLVLARHRSDVLDPRVLRQMRARLETLVAEAVRTLALVPSVAAGSDLAFSSALRDVIGSVLDRLTPGSSIPPAECRGHGED